MPSLFNRIKKWLGFYASKNNTLVVNVNVNESEAEATDHDSSEPVREVVPYDENLLERSRTQWQFGDWESLTKLERDTLQHHPDRAKLALLAAAGHLQQGNSTEARQFTRLAQDWGCSKKLVSQILISGVHNSLGRASASIGEQTRAMRHFQASILTGTPGNAANLITSARANEQLQQLGLPVSHERLSIDTNTKAATSIGRNSQ